MNNPWFKNTQRGNDKLKNKFLEPGHAVKNCKSQMIQPNLYKIEHLSTYARLWPQQHSSSGCAVLSMRQTEIWAFLSINSDTDTTENL